MAPRLARRDSWRFDDGEEAQITSGGRALIRSRGHLPVRYRREASQKHFLPAFPGTAVRLGDDLFEVVSEESSAAGILYHLEPWPREQVIRDQVAYGRKLVQDAQAERARVASRARARLWSWLVAPLVGFLPEDHQLRVCDSLGLDPTRATFYSGIFEALAILFALRSIAARTLWAMIDAGFEASVDPIDVGMSYEVGMGGGVVQGLLWGAIVLPWAGVWASTGVLRSLWAAAFREVSGSVVGVVVFSALAALGRQRVRFDSTTLPLTRGAFWKRLELPDNLLRQPDGAVMVRSLLPHVSWESAPRLRFGDDYWIARRLLPTQERGRLVYAYRLEPEAEGSAGDAIAADAYQAEVVAQVDRGWEDLFQTGLAPLIALLPSSAQARAFRQRGGPRGAYPWTMLTAGAQLIGAIWLASSLAPLALWLAVEGLVRLILAVQGRFAPSLLGIALAPVLSLERSHYIAHRDAERAALAELDDLRED